MKTSLTYGFAMAIAGAVLTFAMFLLGFHDSAEKLQSGVAKTIGYVAPMAIGITCLILAMKEKRELTPADQNWGYGSALGVGTLTALWGSLIGAVLSYIYFAYINPHMSDVIYQAQVAAMEAKGMSSDQIEKAESMMRKFMTPAMMTIFNTVGGFFWGFVFALIIAIFFRKRPASAELAEPPTNA